MFLSTNRIERLNKFILKALGKAIKAGTRIIELYTGCGEKIEILKKVIETLKETVRKIESMSAEEEKIAADDDLKIEEV